MKSQINIRASDLLQRQLDELTAHLGTSITETVSIAIDRLYQQENLQVNASLTLEQKQAAIAIRNVRDYAATNDTTEADAAMEFDVATSDLQLGSRVLETHSLHRFDRHQSLNMAHRQADQLEKDGYETYIEEWEGPNRYCVVGFKSK